MSGIGFCCLLPKEACFTLLLINFPAEKLPANLFPIETPVHLDGVHDQYSYAAGSIARAEILHV